MIAREKWVDAEGRCPLCGGPLTLRTARYGSNAGYEFWGCTRYPNCKGSLNIDGSIPDRSAKKTAAKNAVAENANNQTAASLYPAGGRGKTRSLRRGDLLTSENNSLGPGKLVAKDGDDLVLEYFDTPGQAPEARTRLSVPRIGLRRFALKAETRVFWISAAKWRSGRVIETTSHGDIYIRAHDWEGYVPEEDLFVRWHPPLTDPVGFAAGGLLESPLLADLRRPFLQAILRQRSAARGMKGALSSAIELHDHQVETAWRVLQDPVQRYLLADEVGLGKTIEAGIILRQLLLDHPELSVQLILPPFLIGQWQQELADKFFLNDFTQANIRFARNDEPSTWAPADLLIIDEAHNLAALADSNQPDLAARYAKLTETGTHSTRILMLSATPALNNEPVFLQMLKLLDPAVYADVSVEDFRKRLAARAELGRIFLGLQPKGPAVLLRKRLTELGNELPGDTDVEQLLAIASDALDTKNPDILKDAIDSLRTHVAEIYRVHRRMLRTRRTSALQATYRVTGRRAPEALTLESDLLTETTRLLEAWRQEALAAHEEDPITLPSPARALAEAVSLSLDPEALAGWASARAASTPGEQTALDRIVQDLAFTNRREMVARPIADALSYLVKAKERIVVFCPSGGLVAELANALREFLPADAVLEHRATDIPEHIESVIRRFETARDTAVLIADSSAEEGRNFQFANLLVHVGVPSDANRMEQRIGRCDRWQMHDVQGEWRSLTVTESSTFETFDSAWTHILKDGFGVFDSSIASLQFAVEAATESAWQQLFAEGIKATELIIKSVRSSLEEEIGRIREQDALDSIESSSERGSVYSQLAEFESSESEFAGLTHALLATVPGNLRFNVVGDPVNGVGGYKVLSGLPGKLHIPLVPVERLKRDFLPIRDLRGTYLRSIAIKHRDTHLYRYGDPFIDAVSDFLWNDDRGRAFGMWRWVPDWGYGERIAYRFDYAVEAQPLGNETARATLAHRADGLFPPLIVTVWVDDSGHQLTDSDLLKVLQEPYRKPQDKPAGGDYSLSRSRIEAAYHYVPAAQWSQEWHDAEIAAVSLVQSLAEVQDAIATALQQAQADSAKRVKQLMLRATRAAGSERVALEHEATVEEAAGLALTKAIATPTLRLDGTGIVIVSGEELTMDGDA
ncbi:ATP-dependent helicase HepA [Arthrobacter pascens]|uniref:protein DpdE n=1 Tax=Arthrobacter pascens TaxID=1677 RepID=UPI00278E495C|nr:protein DpdE [Arthrobacter pascens]MDQ0679673.1 ATP-dependent helicase HepA [Arthrobacter pascens]